MYRKPSCMNQREINVAVSLVIVSKRSSWVGIRVEFDPVGGRKVAAGGIDKAAEHDQFEAAHATYLLKDPRQI